MVGAAAAVVVVLAGGWLLLGDGSGTDAGEEPPTAFQKSADPTQTGAKDPTPDDAAAEAAAAPAEAAPGPGAPATPGRRGPPRLRDFGIGPDQFVSIQAGIFQMGSLEGVDNERPRHTVSITQPFYLQATEVTQGQWRSVMGHNPSHYLDCGDECPVETVSWEDVQRFLLRLNESVSRGAFRLPTEAEWEYAARAGTTGDYGGTERLGEMGWFFDNSDYRTHPVGEKAPNDWGLYDMHGNVMEWVNDWFDPEYYSEPNIDTDPTGPSEGTTRIARGGSWFDDEYMARSAYRGGLDPGTTLGRIGFRLVWDPEG
jgi:formylglycine-generating enzyme required for sulfatase activity